MNEVLAVLYYCFYSSNTDQILPQKYIEADIFYAFSALMVDLRDGFLRELDKEDSGLNGHIEHYEQVLNVLDPVLYDVIEQN